MPTDVPSQDLRTLSLFVTPMPIPSISIISLPTLTKSPPKNDVIPVNSIKSSVVVTSSDKVVVSATETTGDCIILSIETITLEF